MSIPQIKEESFLVGFSNQNIGMKKFLRDNSAIRVGTLGPPGTTSSGAAIFFIDNIKAYNQGISINLKLWNHFDLVYEGLLNNDVDLIVIPNPYEDVGKIYWDSDLELIFSFILESPYYGLAALDKEFVNRKHLQIATGPGVHSLIKRLGKELLKSHSFELYHVNSTTEAAMAVQRRQADLAVTNKTSLDKTKLSFVTPVINTKILWSVFRRK